MTAQSIFATGPCDLAITDLHGGNTTLSAMTYGDAQNFTDGAGNVVTVDVDSNGVIFFSRATAFANTDGYSVVVTPQNPPTDESTRIWMQDFYITTWQWANTAACINGDSTNTQILTPDQNGSCTPDPAPVSTLWDVQACTYTFTLEGRPS